MNASAGIRMKQPARPGVVKHETIESLSLSVTRAAEVLGVTRATLSTLLNERHLSPEMAVRIEKAFGVPMDTLMRMQNSYDIAPARERSGRINMVRFGAAAEPARRRFRARGVDGSPLASRGLERTHRRAPARCRRSAAGSGVPEPTRAALAALGWVFRKSDVSFGGYQAIERLPGRYAAATEMRKDGVALAW